jgi:hypothetical protein
MAIIGRYGTFKVRIAAVSKKKKRTGQIPTDCSRGDRGDAVKGWISAVATEAQLNPSQDHL